MPARDPALDGELTRPGTHIPQAAQLRLIADPAVLDAALTLLADMFGAAWQPSTRKPARASAGHIQYGTLIVPVPR